MKRALLTVFILFCTTFLWAQVSNDNEDGVYKIDRHAISYRQGEVIVKFRGSTPMNAKVSGAKATTGVSNIDKLFDKLVVKDLEELMPLTAKRNVGNRSKALNGKIIESKDLSGMYKIKFDTSANLSVSEVVEELKSLNEVELAEPNYMVYIQSDETEDVSYNDPLYSLQGNLSACNINKLWGIPKITTKRPVIAILDTGVDINHPDLKNNIWSNVLEEEGAADSDDDNNGFNDDIHGWDFVNKTPYIRDNNGHGTHVAGIAGAVGNNGIGIVGANPDVLIMPVTVMQSDGLGDIATIIKGIDYAVANGADVINMSFGTYAYSIALNQSLSHAYADAILVAAAGNDRIEIDNGPCFPAAFNYVLGIQDYEPYSNYDDDGPLFSKFNEENQYNYELIAPGSDILSTYPNGGYKNMTGTSMSCPLVAGAISALLQRKQYDSKEILFGDLILSSNGGVLDIASAYNIGDNDRKPKIGVISIKIDDEKYGDGDGNYDAGETLAIYPTLRNFFGHAENIKFSMELAENEDPAIVSMLTNDIDFGKSLSAYSKSVSDNPALIKISENCVDGRHIRLRLKVTCDEVEEVVYKDITITVTNGVELNGVITEDLTLYPNVHYIVTSNLGIAKNATLTIKPGTTLKFKDDTGITVFGKLNAIGTPDSMIVFTKTDLGSGKNVIIKLDNSIYKYTDFSYLDRFRNEGTLENCIIHYFTSEYYNLFDGDVGWKWDIEDVYRWSAHLYNCNVFYNRGYDVLGANLHNGNNFVGNEADWSYRDWGIINIHGNCRENVFSNAQKAEYLSYEPAVMAENDMPYLGSNNEKILRETIKDYYSGYGWGVVDLGKLPTRPYPEAHGIVWKVLVNGIDAQDEFDMLTPLGVGKHRFDVYFNRPMNKNVKPKISMGVRVPYTQTAIEEDGTWNASGDIYTAYLTITGKSNFDGLNRIRVFAARDNENFEIPEEQSRFNVMVQKAGSMSTGLIAEAGVGKVSLTWKTATEDFADLMGYNVYRYETTPETAKMLNSTLIDAEETKFIDYDVVPGNTYYYMVKEMGTDLQQQDVSNVVAATPLTAQKGDANGSMTVDVADVVTEINYLTNGNPQPFIFEAADVNSDKTINILDVVGTVNLIINPSNVKSMSVGDVATYTIEDGILYVDSPVSLGGIQLTLETEENAEFTALSALNGMEQVGAWLNNSKYVFLAYSMNGKTIPSGRQPLLKLNDTNAVNMVLSDSDGKNIIAINESATKIDELPFGIDATDMTSVRYCDVMGRSISKAAALRKGFYIMSIYVGDKCVKNYKMLNK